MRLSEVVANPDAEKLAAISQFLLGRASDTDSRRVYDYPAFKQLAAGQTISLTKSQLRDMIQRPPLNGLIVDVTGDDNDENSGQVIFKGAEVTPDTMTVDQARQTVDSMAKRAIDIK